jgi:hypothetical protein
MCRAIRPAPHAGAHEIQAIHSHSNALLPSIHTMHNRTVNVRWRF